MRKKEQKMNDDLFFEKITEICGSKEKALSAIIFLACIVMTDQQKKDFLEEINKEN